MPSALEPLKDNFMDEQQQSGLSEINYLLLQLVRAYKDRERQALAYRGLLLAREPVISGEQFQTAVNDILSLVPSKFQEAENALLDGNSPLQVLRGFLNPQ
jgi:hypothetical protein